MKYYQVQLNFDYRDKYYYSSEVDIPLYARVLVLFNRSLRTGIVTEEVFIDEINPFIEYKPVIEQIDMNSLFTEDLITLAHWMSRYYQCSLGRVLFTMLPAPLQVEISTDVKMVFLPIDRHANEHLLASCLVQDIWKPIHELRAPLNTIPMYKTIEQAEENGWLQVRRTCDSKIKPKQLLFYSLCVPTLSTKLTIKQQAALDEIISLGDNACSATFSEAVTPSLLKALLSKGFISSEYRPVSIITGVQNKVDKSPLILTDEQQTAVGSLKSAYGMHEVFVLFGITGSGKTQVYLEIVKYCIQRGETALLLVPEIALTPQLVERFLEIGEDQLAVQHSQMTDRQRYEQWQRIRKGECKLVIGARSAIFAPLPNLGLIIVDEEHEGTYKQENSPKYQARDLAVLRGKQTSSLVILGSATPSLETWLNCEKGRYKKLLLTKRPLSSTLPAIEIIDMKKVPVGELLSPTLQQAIAMRLSKKEQVILFQNRRGFSSYLLCTSCGHVFKCPHCDVSMTYHKDQNELLCHYCGHHETVSRQCPACGGFHFSYGAPGTQKVQQYLELLYPQAKIMRLDSDTAGKKAAIDTMHNGMRQGDVDILLGTQMISKGLDFANVTLVGVILADTTLNIPDFRSAERTFQLLTQVAGRAGRSSKKGEVIIQTWSPDNYAIVAACRQDIQSFIAEESMYREALGYPPYQRLARLVFSHPKEMILQEQMKILKPLMQQLRAAFIEESLHILGPTPAPFTRLKNQYRFHMLFKAKKVEVIHQTIRTFMENNPLSPSIQIQIDIDPYNLL